jgi:hypothetical protein
MKIVIKISDEDYKAIAKGYLPYGAIAEAIRNGTPLPKGHGDLKDAEKLKNAFIIWSIAVHGNFTDADIASIIYNSPTIIESDKESESE